MLEGLGHFSTNAPDQEADELVKDQITFMKRKGHELRVKY